MAFYSDSFLVLGAFLGVAAVYLIPYSISSKSTECKTKKIGNNGSIIIFPESAGVLMDESTLKLYGETTINDVLNMIKIEISKVLKAEKWTIIVPREKNSSPNFYDARSQFVTPTSAIQSDLLEVNDSPNDCTEYKDIPHSLFSVNKIKSEKTKTNMHKHCKGIKCLDASNDNQPTHLPRQSTFINTNNQKCAKYVILGEKTIEELETFAADSDYSVITVENDNIQISLKKSKSPLNRLFHGVRSFLGFKRNLRKKSNSLNNNLTKIKIENSNKNYTA